MLGKIFGNKKTDDEVTAQPSVPIEPKKKGIIGGIKDKAVEKMMERQLKALPPQQREMMINAVKNNPDFFKMIADKIQAEEKKNGGNQMAAAMKIMREHQGDMMKIMMGQK